MNWGVFLFFMSPFIICFVKEAFKSYCESQTPEYKKKMAENAEFAKNYTRRNIERRSWDRKNLEYQKGLVEKYKAHIGDPEYEKKPWFNFRTFSDYVLDEEKTLNRMIEFNHYNNAKVVARQLMTAESNPASTYSIVPKKVRTAYFTQKSNTGPHSCVGCDGASINRSLDKNRDTILTWFEDWLKENGQDTSPLKYEDWLDGWLDEIIKFNGDKAYN